ncbi:MAG: DMT family transporter [Desulfurococcales archaeon]|nr:DMT family transporter [Desulfurococcales archaeon]
MSRIATRLAPLLYLVIVLSISSASILVLLSGASAVACAFWRTLVAGVLMTAVCASSSGFAGITHKYKYLIYSTVAGVMLSAHFIMWMKSLFLVPVAVSTTTVITYPLFNALADAVLLREPPTKMQVVGMLLAFTGVVLFLHPGISTGYDVVGVVLALASAIAAATYFNLGRVVRKKVGLGEYTSVTYLVSAAVTAIYAAVNSENIVTYPPRTYAYFILLAVIPMIGGHTLMNYLLRYFKTHIITSLSFIEPLGASVLAYLFLGQHITAYIAISMSLVLVGVFITVLGGLKVA